MTYGNQRDHALLDRQGIRDLLMQYRNAMVSASPGTLPRAEHLKRLMNQAGSDLEKAWLQYLDSHDLRLPSKAQVFLERCQTRPDFLYEDDLTIIYVDGPVHEFPDRAKRDTEQTECLEDLGYTVIRFGHKDDWDKIIARFPNVFGPLKAG